MADTNNKPLAGKVFTEDTVKALSEAYAYHACERGILIDHMHQALTDLGAEIVAGAAGGGGAYKGGFKKS